MSQISRTRGFTYLKVHENGRKRPLTAASHPGTIDSHPMTATAARGRHKATSGRLESHVWEAGDRPETAGK